MAKGALATYTVINRAFARALEEDGVRYAES